MTIDYSKSFKKSYKKLDLFVREKIKDRIKLFSENKFHTLLNNHSVNPTYDTGRSINITGDYRAIYVEHEGVVVFIEIGTHSELYK